MTVFSLLFIMPLLLRTLKLNEVLIVFPQSVFLI